MYEQDDILGFKVEPKRENLIALAGNSDRLWFNAVFADEFKSKEDNFVPRGHHLSTHDKVYKGQRFTLLKCLCDENGEKIAEHLWVLFSKKMKQLDLKRGDKIKFRAKVYKYSKNTKTCDSRRLKEHWSLRSITDLEKVGNVL